MEKRLIRWKAIEERPCPKGRLWLCIIDFTTEEKNAVTRELRDNFGSNFKIEDANENSIKGFVECYHDEVIDKMLQNGWEW